MSLFALDIIVRASALVAAAALADLVLRRSASAATRHLLWTLAIGALLALPIASWTSSRSGPCPFRSRGRSRRASPLRDCRPQRAATPGSGLDVRLWSSGLEDGRRCGPNTVPAGPNPHCRAWRA